MRIDRIYYFIEDLMDRWESERIAIRPGVSNEAFDAFEARYGVKMPPDFRAYFATVNGMGEKDWDHNFCQFLPLDRCVPIADHCEEFAHLEWASRTFLLVDHSIEVFFYAICLSPDPLEECPVILWEGPDRWAFSASFSEFLVRYLEDRAFFAVGAKIED